MSVKLDQIKILQHNHRKSKGQTTIPSLADPKVLAHHFICLQECHRNKNKNSTYCPRSTGFHAVCPDFKNFRVATLVNNEIPTNAWSSECPGPDLCTIRVQTDNGPINIHNVYNPSPQSETQRRPGTLPMLRKQLRKPGKHVIVGDFNLHHPLWGGTRQITQQASADILIDILDEFDLVPVLEPGTITWERQNAISTIDLVFVTSSLVESLIHCRVRDDLQYSSDHKPISTAFMLTVPEEARPIRRAWKKTDEKKLVRLVVEGLPKVEKLPLNTREDLDGAVVSLAELIQGAIECAVPIAKPYKAARSFWNSDCTEKIQTTKRLQRRWQATRDDEDWIEYRRAANMKGKTLRRAKNLQFRRETAEAAQTKNIWKLAKWARTESHRPKSLPQFPTINFQGEEATTIEDKARLLSKKFFPPPPAATLGDIEGFDYPPPVQISRLTTKDDITAYIRRVKADKAPGPDTITNRILKILADHISQPLERIFNECVELGYHPKHFREATTIALKKPGKADYTEAGNYRPIALLNTLGKILEAVIAAKITNAAEEHDLLPPTQMGARKDRSTGTALQLLTEQVTTIWKQDPKRVVSVLGLDISGAFDHVNHARLLHNLRKRRIPIFIVDWISSFLTDRTTDLKLGNYISERMEVNTGIPQGSVLSPILFLFFSADLLDICARSGSSISGLGFVDDTTVITHGSTTDETCANLDGIHRELVQCAKAHGVTFAPKKYELMHMTRTPRNHNMKRTLTVEGAEIKPSTDIRILGVQVDSKLKWGAHINKIQEKMVSQTRALTLLKASTWGASFARARHIYTAVIRPALTFGAPVWYDPEGSKDHRKGILKRMEKIQNKCLRIVTGAYRATNTKVVENEARVLPIETYMEGQIINAHREDRPKIDSVITNACRNIRNKLRGRRGRTKTLGITPRQAKIEWARKVTQEWIPRPRSEEHPYKDIKKIATRRYQEYKRRTRWETFQCRTNRRQQPADSAPCDNKVLRLRTGLSAAEATVATLVRTGKIGLNGFLFDMKVPGVTSPACSCGWRRQTAEHVVIFCPEWREGRARMLRKAGTEDFLTLVSTNKGLKAMCPWIIAKGYLGQFSLARLEAVENTQGGGVLEV